MQVEGRLSFCHIRKARQFQSGEPRFELNVLIPKEETEAITMIEQAIEDAKVEKWGERGRKKKMTGICWQDGNEVDYEGCAGNMILKLARKEDHGAPSVFGPRASEGEIESGSPYEPYSGCYGRVEFNIYASDNYQANRVNGSLQGVQFVRHGPRLSGSAKAKPEAFEDLPEESDPFGEEAEGAENSDPAFQ